MHMRKVTLTIQTFVTAETDLGLSNATIKISSVISEAVSNLNCKSLTYRIKVLGTRQTYKGIHKLSNPITQIHSLPSSSRQRVS